ncbi:hypothetical protein IFM89_032196 [Coptis chinensis]|uniref:Uncharacterized protein n=1 Tax=Coptis chinensis TaxID=261450 RepID=A0A835ME43_9MAGN|nr:hypothetical protein IFM89_032196 [Coptis chinensis]
MEDFMSREEYRKTPIQFRPKSQKAVVCSSRGPKVGGRTMYKKALALNSPQLINEDISLELSRSRSRLDNSVLKRSYQSGEAKYYLSM